MSRPEQIVLMSVMKLSGSHTFREFARASHGLRFVVLSLHVCMFACENYVCEFSRVLLEASGGVTTVMLRTGRNDHTTLTAPHPVRSAKLSTVGPG
jgi:hypothetical protein